MSPSPPPTSAEVDPPTGEPAVIRDFADWCVLNKPAGWHCVHNARSKEPAPTVEGWLRNRFAWTSDLNEGGLVHRLDFETTGCLLVAKNLTALERLREAMKHEPDASGHGIKKTYLAIVRAGVQNRGEFRFHFTSRHKGSKKITARNTGEPSTLGVCRWNLIKRGALGDLIDVDLVGPGKRHQIRAGMAAIGHPLVGDTLYGGSSCMHGIALHAWKLQLERTAVQCEPPAWLSEI